MECIGNFSIHCERLDSNHNWFFCNNNVIMTRDHTA